MGKVVGWWKAKKKFTADDGESHSLYFKGSAKSAQLTIASKPRLYSAFISQVSVSGKSAKFKKAKSEAQAVAKKIDANRNKDPKKGVQTDKMTTWLSELARHTKILASERPQNPPSVISFGGLNSNGGGTKMTAEVLSSNTTKGSKPTDKPQIWQEVGKRKVSGVSDYFQGHLLNEQLGGPGRAHNLSPITRSANAQHLRDVEGPLKQRVLGQKKVVKYTVTASYGSHPSRGFQTELKKKGNDNLKPTEKAKLTLMNYEQKKMPTAFKFSWQLLRYDASKKKWVSDTAAKDKGSGSVPVNLPDGDFKIAAG